MSDYQDQLCLPVIKSHDRFVPDSSHSDSLEELPLYSELSKYLDRHYSRITAALEWKGLSFQAEVFVPNDVEDSAYALVDEGLFSTSKTTLQPSSAPVLKSLSSWLEQNISYSEPPPMGDATRLRTEFVDTKLQVWEGEKVSGALLPWRDLLRRNRVVVLGEPGAGKTTLLRMIALHEGAKLGQTEWWRLPVFISLRQMGECHDILKLARSVLDSQTSLKSAKEFDSALASGRLLLILDGLDELTDSVRPEWAAGIARLSQEYPTLGVYIGTRHWGYDWHFPGFLHAKLQPFDSSQIEEWLRVRLTRSSKELTSHLTSALTTDSDLQTLASTPLTLALLASVYERTGTIPRRKADLISRYLEVVLETWDASRGVRRYTHNFLREEKVEALSLAALAAWKESRMDFTEDAFCTLHQSWSDLGSREAAKRLLRDSGFLTRESGQEQKWLFTHELFRDYLVALYLVERPDQVLAWLGTGVTEGRTLRLWRYACGIAADASPLLRALAAEPKIHSYEKAHWFLAALSDGINASSEVIDAAATRIVETLESGIAARHISHVDVAERLCRVVLPGSGVEVQALSEIVRLLVGGGWNSSRWLGDRLERLQSDIAKQISRLLRTNWKVRKVSDPEHEEVHVVGSR